MSNDDIFSNGDDANNQSQIPEPQSNEEETERIDSTGKDETLTENANTPPVTAENDADRDGDKGDLPSKEEDPPASEAVEPDNAVVDPELAQQIDAQGTPEEDVQTALTDTVPELQTDDDSLEENSLDAEELAQQVRGESSASQEAEQYLKELNRRNNELENAQADQKSLEFPLADRASLKRIEDVFVSTDRFDEFFAIQDEDQRQRNIFLIAGPPNTGRYAVALHLALRLNGHSPVSSIREHIPDRTTESLSLLDIINRLLAQQQQRTDSSVNFNDPRHIPKGAVVIIRDTFSGQIGNIRELSASYARRFSKMLDKSNIRIILTTDRRPEDHRVEFSNFPYVVTVDEQDEPLVDLEAVYSRHLDLYFTPENPFTEDMRELIQQTMPDILKLLTRPVDVYTFFEDISNAEPATFEEVTAIAEKIIGNLDRRAQTREWFEELTFNEKLYVMFAVLFQGLNRYQVDELYDESVQYLRRQMGEAFDDPRHISVETLLDRVHLKEHREILEFPGKRKRVLRDYEDEIQYQIKNYYRLLWSLVELFTEKIKKIPPDAHQQRRLLATVVGQIGIYRKDRLRRILDELATDSSAVVTISTGETLAYIARYVDQHPFVIEVLRRWVDSKNFDMMWAAAIGIDRVYRSITITFTSTRYTQNNETDESALSATQIALQTLQILQQILAQLVDNLRDVDTKSFNEFLQRQYESELDEAFEATITHIEADKNLKSLLGLLPDETKTLLHKQIRKAVEKKIKENHDKRRISYWLELVDTLTLTIVFSVVEIAKNSPPDMVNLLVEWLAGEPEQLRWQIARLATSQLYRDTVESDRGVVDVDQLPYLELLPSMLSASEDMRANVLEVLLTLAFGEQMSKEREGGGAARGRITQISLQSPIDTALETLDTWYDYLQEGNEADTAPSQEQNIWRDHIYPALLKTVNTARQGTRRILGDALISNWLDSEHIEVRRSAMALLTRAYVLDGIVLDVPISRYGILMVDAGGDADDEYFKAVFNLSQRLTTLTPLRIFHLGWTLEEHLNMGVFHQDDVSAGTIQSDKLRLRSAARPRLLMPILDPIDSNIQRTVVQDCHFVLVLNTNTIVDWDEILSDAMDRYQSTQDAIFEFNPFEIDAIDDNPQPALEPEPDIFGAITAETPQTTALFMDDDNPFFSEQERKEMRLKYLEQQSAPDEVNATNSAPSSLAADVKFDWVWHGKFFMNAGNEVPLTHYHLPDGTINTYTIGIGSQAGTRLIKQHRELEIRLQQQIIMNLHQMSVEQWLSDLLKYRQDDRDTFHDIFSLIIQLDRWMTQLDDVMETIPPRDVTLSIAWAILLLSKQDLPATIDIVCSWLKSSEDNYRLMGHACTKQLFNFYGASEFLAQPEQHGILLRLLPPFMEQEPDWREFQQIIRVIIKWSKQRAWSERLITHPDGAAPELITALSKISNSADADWLISEIEYYEAFLRIQDLFLQLRQNNPRFTLEDFTELSIALLYWMQSELERIKELARIGTQGTEQAAQIPATQRRRRRGGRRGQRGATPQLDPHKPTPLPNGISIETARQLLELPGLNQYNRNRILEDMEQVLQQLKHDKRYRLNLTSAVRNMKSVMDTMRLQLYSRDTQRPILPEGKQYALFLIDVSSRAESARAELPAMLIDLLKALIKSESVDKFVPVIHRMGRYDVIYTHQQKPRKINLKPEEVWPKHMRHRFPSIIGPIVSNYPPDSVGFVVLLTASSIYDIEDFDEANEWSSRMFVHSMTPSTHIKNIEKILQEDPEKVIKRILSKITKRG